MEEDTEYLKLSTEEQCQHKLWKARLKGYEDAAKLFQQLDERAPEFNKYAGQIKKFVTDSNAVAQEKGLEAALVFIENAHVAGRICGDVTAGVVQKAIAAPKTSVREKSKELLLMIIEIEKQEVVQEELIKGFAQKNPKVVAGCINALTAALSAFGHTILNLKPLVKKIPEIMEHKDKNVREEAKALIVELQCWIGPAIKPHLSSLKPIQVSELETEFEKSAGRKPQQTRFLRSQQDLRAKMEAQGEHDEGTDDGDDGDEEAPAIDPLDLMDPVNILSQLPKEFYTNLEAKKWQERKQALEDLHALVTKNPKLATGDYADLVKHLKRIISKDTNVMVIALAGQCLAGLARGLRKHFGPYAVACISAIIEKFKEKKVNVVTALREAADAIYPSTSLEAIQDDVFEGLNNKNPSVKSETASFLARSFCFCTPAVLNKKLLKAFVPELLKLLADSDPAVRESASCALGTIWKVVGEKVITPFMGDLDALKLAKVKEYSEKAEIKVKVPSAKSKPAVGAASSAPASAPSKPKTVKSGGAMKKAAAGGKKAGKTSARAAAPGDDAAASEPTEPELADEEAEQLVIELLSEDLVKQLTDANWKTRLAAVESLQQSLSGRTDLPTQALLIILSRKPGLKDNNFQILKLKLDFVRQLAENTKFTRRSADLCIPDLVEKLGDAKNGAAAAEVLTAVSEAVGLEPVASQVLQLAFNQKSPKVQENALSWLSKGILEFGFTLKPKSVVNYVRAALAHTSPAVRGAAISLLGTMYMYMGSTLRTLFEDEKSALLQQIDAEFQRVGGEKPPAPCRGRKAAAAKGTEENETPLSTSSPVEDLVPRMDISDRITSGLIAEMGDKNWKVRMEALQKVSDILREAKFVTANIGELGSALATRCTDSNKNLAAEGLRLSETLGTALGPHCRHHLRTVVPGLLCSLGDNKPNIRQSALNTLNTWLQQISFGDFLDGEILADALKSGTPNTRAELLTWMSVNLRDSGALPREDLLACLPHLYGALEDRSAEVRKSATDSVLPFMMHLGFDAMSRAAGKLKPVSKASVLSALEKERPNLPAKAPARARPAGKAGRPTTQSTESLDEEETSAPPAGKTVKTGAKARASSKPRAGAKGSASRTGRGDEDADASPTLQVNNMKKQRVQDEIKLRSLKWNFTTPRPEFLDQLKDQMTTANVNANLMVQLFHADFKQHIKAIGSIAACADTNLDAVVANLDLLLKWLTIRFFDTNPTVIMKGLEAYHQIFIRLAEDDYRLLEQEATAFIPYLILKLGDPKDNIRLSARNIFRELYKIYPSSKVFACIMDGLKSKNGRQRAECLEEIGYLIERNGMSVCQPTAGAAMKEVARQIGDRDNTVRKAALNALVQAYYITGEKIYKLIGNISDKDMSLLEERIKRAPRRPPAPPPVAAVAPVERVRACAEPAAADTDTPSRPDPEADSPAARELRPSNEVSDYHDQLMKMYPRLPVEDGIEQKLEYYGDLSSRLEEVINEPPMPMPTFKHSWSKPRAAPAFDRAEVEQWVSQLADSEAVIVRRGVGRLMSLLKSNEPETLAPHVDALLEACNSQYSGVLSAAGEPAAPLCRELAALLTTLLHFPQLADRCSGPSLQALIATLLSIITSPQVSKLADASVLTGAANKLAIRLVEHANHTNVVCALVGMLQQSVRANNMAVSEYQTLLMKCIWKVVRLLPGWARQLDMPAILLEIHRFLEAFPSSCWKQAPADTPFRTVKTVLHSLATIYGYVILTKVGRIPHADKSEVLAYLTRVLLQTGGQPSQNIARGSQVSVLGDWSGSNAASLGSASAPHALSRSKHEQLSDIFKKIGSKENTKEGLVELYEFKQRSPDADIQPFLAKSSKFFQNYVERGLRAIESERLRSGQSGASASTAAVSISSGGGGGAVEAREAEFFRLKARLDPQLPPKPSVDDPQAPEKWMELLKGLLKHWPSLEHKTAEIDEALASLRAPGGGGGGGQRPADLSQETPSSPSITGLSSLSQRLLTLSPQSSQQLNADPEEIEEYRRRLANLKDM